MKYQTGLSLLVASLVANFVLAASVSNLQLHKAAFENFKLVHNKQYENADDELARFEIFSDNMQKIQRHNSKPSSYKLAVNKFTDLNETKMITGTRAPTRNEFKQFIDNEFVNSLLYGDDDQVPDEYDWRKVDGVVTAVKDQGDTCGSCWAFATTGVLEGQQKKLGLGKLTDLSEQDLIDCSRCNYACNGGLVAYTLFDIHSKGGIESSADYPYEGEEVMCRFKKSKSVMTVSKAIVLAELSEEELKKIVYKYGPVSIGISFTPNAYTSFHSYSGGVFSGCDQNYYSGHHAMLIVGYGVDKDHGDYWIVKNSYGPNWGENGYMRMLRNVNMCDLQDYPTIAKF